MKIVTFNLRCIYDNRAIDGDNTFVGRRAFIQKAITAANPDVIGFQEATPPAVADLRRLLPAYTVLFNPRTANFDGEGLAIAYKTDCVELLSLDCFWLSETPRVPGSRYLHQSECPRVCQAALLKCKDELFRVYNVHLDHIDDEARRLGIAQVLNSMAEDAAVMPTPVFLLGDFNALLDSGTVALCDEFAALPLQDLTKESGGTFHNFGRKTPEKIDYIYADAQTAAKSYQMQVWTDCENGIYLSDHYPIEVTICL